MNNKLFIIIFENIPKYNTTCRFSCALLRGLPGCPGLPLSLQPLPNRFQAEPAHESERKLGSRTWVRTPPTWRGTRTRHPIPQVSRSASWHRRALPFLCSSSERLGGFAQEVLLNQGFPIDLVPSLLQQPKCSQDAQFSVDVMQKKYGDYLQLSIEKLSGKCSAKTREKKQKKYKNTKGKRLI